MPKQPQDHNDGTFTWQSPAGVTVTLPSLNTIPAGALRKYRKLDELDFMFSILEDVLDEGALADLDALGIGDIQRLFADWQAAEGASFPQS